MRGNTISIELPLKRGKVSKTIPLYQYDYGQKLLITGAELPEYYEVHFSNEMHGDAVTSIGDSTGVLIPDSLLATGDNIYLWLYLHADSDDGETEFQGAIPVIKRAQVTDQTPTPAEQSVITQAIAALTAASAEATAAKEDAEAAQQHIENMGVAATTLPTDSDATVTKTVNASGEVTLTFGLPRGVKGDRGDRGLQGETGNDGEDGEDGFSPVVSLTKSGKVTTFSVTDAEDTYSVEINDGEDGNPGQDATPDLITVDYSDLTFPVAAGTMCYHSGLLYKANQAIATSEEWTAAHWTQTTIEEEHLSLKTEIINDMRYIVGKPDLLSEAGWNVGAYISATGVITTYSTAKYTNLIPVNGDNYTYYYIASTTSGTTRVHGYDSNGDWVAQITTAATGTTVATKEISILTHGYAFIRISESTTITPIVLVEKNSVIKDISDLSDAIDQITVAHVSVNKFDINDPLTKHYKLWQNGTLSDSGASHYFVTQPIAVTAGDVVRRNVTSSSGIQFGAYVNADGTPGESPRTISTNEGVWTATRTGYISVNFSAVRLQNAMVTINADIPDEYTPYYNHVSFGDGIHLGDTQIEDVRGYGSTISGKLIAYNGDSICESRINQGTADNGGAYAKIIADIVHGTYANRAISGGILASAPGDGGSTPNRCVVSDVANMADDADLICFEGGINDYWRDVPLGDYSESDYSGTLDTTTVCGALESIFRQATAKWVGKPIVFVIVHKIKSTVYAANFAGWTFAQGREKMIGICQKYAIPYYDAYAESGLNAYNDIQNTNYLTSNATGNPDGCHPNEAAYRRYYVPQLIALFESVMPRLDGENTAESDDSEESEGD